LQIRLFVIFTFSHPHQLSVPVQAIETIAAFFHRNPQAEAYFAIVDVEGNAKVLAPPPLKLDTLETFYLSDSSGCCTSSEKTRQGRICLQCRLRRWQGHTR
jgi:hypothetical protein